MSEIENNHPEKKLKILVVDDEPGSLESLRMILEIKDHEVSTHLNGLDALEEAAKTAFDVAFIDDMMPTINGIELIKKLKFDSPQTMIILLTARDLACFLKVRENRFHPTVENPVFYVLRKPFLMEEVYSLIDAAKHKTEGRLSKISDYAHYMSELVSTDNKQTRIPEIGEQKRQEREEQSLKIFVQNQQMRGDIGEEVTGTKQRFRNLSNTKNGFLLGYPIHKLCNPDCVNKLDKYEVLAFTLSIYSVIMIENLFDEAQQLIDKYNKNQSRDDHRIIKQSVFNIYLRLVRDLWNYKMYSSIVPSEVWSKEEVRELLDTITFQISSYFEINASEMANALVDLQEVEDRYEDKAGPISNNPLYFAAKRFLADDEKRVNVFEVSEIGILLSSFGQVFNETLHDLVQYDRRWKEVFIVDFFKHLQHPAPKTINPN